MSSIKKRFVPARIVSGGQTGVDRSGLDAAIQLGIPHGGWCPKGRISEDGRVPDEYELIEHKDWHYKARTLQNVIDSDATLILYERRLQGGTRLTQRYAVQEGKPYLSVRIDEDWSLDEVQQWLAEVQPETLNVAGPRESNNPGLQQRGTEVMLQILGGR